MSSHSATRNSMRWSSEGCTVEVGVDADVGVIVTCTVLGFEVWTVVRT